MEPVLNQVILIGMFDDNIERGVIRISVDGTFVEIYMSDKMYDEVSDVEDGLLMGVKGHIENTPAGNLMVVADTITYLSFKESEGKA